MTKIGILAYGSLITDPGPELLEATHVRILDVPTPFKVEFARSSRGRDGGPTLVPVETGGGSVKGVLLMMNDSVPPDEARNMLWRRETYQIGSTKKYTQPDPSKPNAVSILDFRDMCDVELVITTRIGANISPLTARHLADLAIASAQAAAGRDRRDGISYLIAAKTAGIETPLMELYEREVLRRTGSQNLEEAWELLATGRDSLST